MLQADAREFEVRGSATVRFSTQDEGEVRRDFARFFSGPQCAVYVASPDGLRPFCATVPNVDFVASSNDRTAQHFQELLREEMRQAGFFITAPLSNIANRAMRCIGTRVPFEIGVEHLRYAGLMQPTFCLVFRAPDRVELVTCAFLQGAQRPTVLLVRSPNLASDGPFEYRVYAATANRTVVEELQAAIAELHGVKGPSVAYNFIRHGVGPRLIALFTIGALLLVLAVCVCVWYTGRKYPTFTRRVDRAS
jgi:hypothetical protein